MEVVMISHEDDGDSKGSTLRKVVHRQKLKSMFTYDGQTTCLPFFPFFVDFPSLDVVRYQQDWSISSRITSFSPGVMMLKAEGNAFTVIRSHFPPNKKMIQVIQEAML